MSVHFGNKLVDGGVVLHLDALNPESYPGSGNRWFDLSNTRSHFTLYNSPTWDGQSLSFASSSAQYAQTDSVATGNFGAGDFTAEFAGVITAHDYVASIFSKRWLDAGGTFDGGGWSWGAGPTAGPTLIANAAPSISGTGNPPYGTPYHGCATITRSGTSATINTYINGVLKSTVTGNLSNSSINNTLTRLRLMAGRQPGGPAPFLYYATGKLYMVRLYSRALSGIEVYVNYDSLKNRF